MGVCAEKTSKDYKLTREDLDNYCIKSYERSIDSIKTGKFAFEYVPVTVGKDTKVD